MYDNNISAKLIIIILSSLIYVNKLTSTVYAWQCGTISDRPLSNRIVGGWETGFAKYPWYVSLILNGYNECGGTLIAPNYILTAAHCFPTDPKNEREWTELFNVTLGVYNRCMIEDTQKHYKVDKVYVHERFRNSRPYYDIALMRINGNTNLFMPICMPTKEISLTSRGRKALIVGLGYRAVDDKEMPCTLQEAIVQIYTDDVCLDVLARNEDDPKDFVNDICAGDIKGGTDTCQGDSGGPLMITGINGEYILLGATSFGYGCGDPDNLGMYTEVASYLKWLQDRMDVNIFGGKPKMYF